VAVDRKPGLQNAHEWLEIVEMALAGVNHALNNRIASLTAMVDLLRMGDSEGAGENFERLAAELPELAECSRVVRLLAGGNPHREEALALDDVLSDVFAIHHFLRDIRDVPIETAPSPASEPIRVERWALVRTLTLLLDEAKRLASESASSVQVVLKSDEQSVSAEFSVATAVEGSVSRVGQAGYAEALSERFGWRVIRRPRLVGLVIPTLRVRRTAGQ
jgi:C4-dicarboxylate-specific signal transduction histidine kinase